MINFFKKLLAQIQLWIFGPPCTYTSCDADKDEQKQEKKPKQGGWVC